MNENKESGWIRKMFKGNKVWVETDDYGRPLVKEGKVRIKYQPDQPHEYRVNPGNLHDLEEEGPQPPPPAGDSVTRTEDARRPEAITIYTDGASSGNPGPAGIGVVLQYGGHEKEISKYIGTATNNIAELEAVRTALLSLRRRDLPVRVYTDSNYVWGLLTMGWQAKKNQELVLSIRKLMEQFNDIQFIRVPGHSGVAGNVRADRLAVQAIKTPGNKG